MPRQWPWALALVAGIIGINSARAADEAPAAALSLELKFLDGLRQRGYFDLALDYIERLRKASETPAELKEVLDYQEGRTILDEATRTGDLERKSSLLERARTRLDEFAKGHPKHPLAPEALVQMARLFVERGLTARIRAGELKDPGEAKAKVAEARAAFGQARAAYDRAAPALQTAFDAFIKTPIPESDPRHGQRERAHIALMNEQLQRAVVDYEEAQTYPPGDKARNDLLDKARVAFNKIHNDYRDWMAGLSARLLEGKCYEEKGELGAAMGIYKELMAHNDADPGLREIQRQAAFFQIIVDGKREEHALAVDEASRWLQTYPRSRVSEEGLGVQLELAKNILAQLDQIGEANREEATRKATDRLKEVVRYFSKYKPEALELLRKYQPRSELKPKQIAQLSYDDALAMGDTAMSTHEWDRALALFQQAVRRSDAVKAPEKVNRPRYFMAWCALEGQRYYEAAVLAEHLARRYPRGDNSAKAAEIGMAAWAQAYNTYLQIDRASDLERLLDLAKYTAKTWPESDTGDAARVTLGDIEFGRGHYAEAAEAFESVRADSPRRLDAQVRAGDAHWRLGEALREQSKTSEAEAEAKKALDLTAGALKAREDSGTPPTDPAFITNANALAEIQRAGGKPADAAKMLEPIANALAKGHPSTEVMPLYVGLLTTLLRAHIGSGEPAKAIADMKTLEQISGSKASLTQLYFELARTLQREMDALKAKNDRAGYLRTQQGYLQFLQALAKSQAGQNYESLAWAGQALLTLDKYKEAGETFARIKKTYGKDPEFQKRKGAQAALQLNDLQLVRALRGQRKFEEGEKLLEAILKDDPRRLEAYQERGYLLEDWARAERTDGRWGASLKYWKSLAAMLGRGRTKKEPYYEALYHVAVALGGLNRKPEAIQTLKATMVLAPSVGGSAELKAKYQALIAQLSR